MQVTIFVLVPFLSGLSLADELAFSNSKEWLSEFRGKWSVCYFFDDSFSTDVHESPVQFIDGRCLVEIAQGPIKTFMLYYDNEPVSILEKDPGGKWHVPKLSHLVFDLRPLKPLHEDEHIAFGIVDPRSGLLGGTAAGKTFERLVEHGATIEVSLVNIDRRKFDATPKALILVSEADHGVVTLAGDIRGNWSMTLTWSSGNERGGNKTSPSGTPSSAPSQLPEGNRPSKPDSKP